MMSHVMETTHALKPKDHLKGYSDACFLGGAWRGQL